MQVLQRTLRQRLARIIKRKENPKIGKLNIVIGNIVSEDLLKTHDAIVNPTNPRMICGSGVSGAIFHSAGVDDLEEYTQKTYDISYNNSKNLMTVGEMRTTPGFALGIDIIFAQGPRAYEYDDETALDLLLETYKNIIDEALKKGYKNILCPSVGTGSYGFTHENIAKPVKSFLENILLDKDLNITFVLNDEADRKYY